MDMSGIQKLQAQAARGANSGGGNWGVRSTQVKNRAPAPVQITSEQILREAQEFREDIVEPPRQEITDEAELKEYQGRKRKEFEDGIRRNRQNVALWLRYGAFESKLGEYGRARSVFERALDVDYRNQSIWLKYAEMEMKNRQVNHARNIWDRAVQLLPRIDQFWYKYAYMEEMLGELQNARTIFERWMKFEPNAQAWLSYIKFEVRHHNIQRARELYDRFTIDQLTLDSYLKYAKFEARYGDIAKARQVYERAQEELREEERNHEDFFIAFAHFEERNKEYDRARAIYQFALDHIPRHRASDLYEKYVTFEKSYGDKDGIELVILAKRRFQYEEEIKNAAANTNTGGGIYNYDIFFDYIRLEQDRLEAILSSVNPAVNNKEQISTQCARIRELYERAVANIPLVLTEKKYWKRYIYLWINWLVFEEMHMKDAPRIRAILNKLLGSNSAAAPGSAAAGAGELIPHSKWSFAKLWIYAAHFEVRQGDLAAARRRFGEALGKLANNPATNHTRNKVFKSYLALELSMGALDRVRKLYEKWLESSSFSSDIWIEFALFEAKLQEIARARTLFQLAISQPQLDQPERVWKACIEFEIGQFNYDRVRELYTRLLEKTQHVKVWISYCQFETTQREYEKARDIFRKAEEYFKTTQARMAEEEREMAASSMGPGAAAANVPASPALLQFKEDRLLLLQSWRDFERNYGGQEQVQELNKKMPQQLKKRRPLLVVGGSAGEVDNNAYEEYYDYVFPEESAKQAASGMQLMERAKMWKRQQEMKAAAEQARLEEARVKEEQASLQAEVDAAMEDDKEEDIDKIADSEEQTVQPGAMVDE